MIHTSGAAIIPGAGAVVRNERLTVVAGGPVIQGSEAIGRATLAMIDQLSADGTWSFEAVAAALHKLVVEHEPRGVAAVLAESDGDVMLFAFDRAIAQSGEVTATGNGRAGWATEVAEDPAIELRLENVAYIPAATDIELRQGLVPGAGAVLTVTPMPLEQTTFQPPAVAAPPPPTGTHATATPPPPAPGPPAFQPPPPSAMPPQEANRVDPMLLPPPPGQSH